MGAAGDVLEVLPLDRELRMRLRHEAHADALRRLDGHDIHHRPVELRPRRQSSNTPSLPRADGEVVLFTNREQERLQPHEKRVAGDLEQVVVPGPRDPEGLVRLLSVRDDHLAVLDGHFIIPRAVDDVDGRLYFFRLARVVKRIKAPVHVDRRAAARRDQSSNARRDRGVEDHAPTLSARR